MAAHLEGNELFCLCDEERNGHSGGVRVYVEAEVQLHIDGNNVAPEFKGKYSDGDASNLPTPRAGLMM